MLISSLKTVKYITQFQQRKQEPHEVIPEFITALRTSADPADWWSQAPHHALDGKYQSL